MLKKDQEIVHKNIFKENKETNKDIITSEIIEDKYENNFEDKKSNKMDLEYNVNLQEKVELSESNNQEQLDKILNMESTRKIINENIDNELEQDFSTKFQNEENINMHLKLNEKDFNGFKDNTDIPNSLKDLSDKEDKISFMIPDEKNSKNIKRRGRQKKNIIKKEDKNKGNQTGKNIQKLSSFNKKIFFENVWVHMSCALWLPEVHIEDFEKKDNIKCKE